MSGATRSRCGAPAFQIGITFQFGPPLCTPVGLGSTKGSLSEALVYIGSGFTALPAAAIASTSRAVYQLLNACSAIGPNTAQLGRASCRERVCQSVVLSVVVGYLNKK